MDEQIDWADVPANHVGPLEGNFQPLGGDLTELASVGQVAEAPQVGENESAKASDEAEAELLAGEDSESDISLDSGNMIKNMTYFEYITHYKTIHHILSMLIESDDDMRDFTEMQRGIDARYYAEKKKKEEQQQQQHQQSQMIQKQQQNQEPVVLPSVNTFFKRPEPANSNIAVTSQGGSVDSVSIGGPEIPKENAVLNGYDPSLWFYKLGRNPIHFVPGQKDRLKKILFLFSCEF